MSSVRIAANRTVGMLDIRTKGSLCTGTGALDGAVPGELRWVCETDGAANAVIRRTHPDVVNFGDLLGVDWNYRQHHVDLLTSGDPCQSMSVAGAKRASDDERFLWPHVMNVIDVTRPRYVFLENVANIVNVPLVKGGERGGVLKLRLDDLREAGYAVRWAVMGACLVGAPHHRHRWFLYAEHVGGSPEACRIQVRTCGATRSGARALMPSPTRADGTSGPRVSPKRQGDMNLRTAVQLLPSPAARDGDGRGEGSPAFWEERRRTRPTNGIPLGAEINLLPSPRATDGTNGGPNQRGSKGDLTMGSACQETNWGRFAEAVKTWEGIIGRPAPEPTEVAPRGGRRLSASLSEWMMGYPTGHLTEGVSRNDALRMAGNGVVSLQARAAWDLLTS